MTNNVSYLSLTSFLTGMTILSALVHLSGLGLTYAKGPTDELA